MELWVDLYKTSWHATSRLYSESHCQQFYFLSFTSYTAQLNPKCTTDIGGKGTYIQTFLTFSTNVSTFAEKVITTFSGHPFLGDHMHLKN